MSEHFDPTVDTTPCPACKAQPGEKCTTYIDGEDVGWTHDARFMSRLVEDIRVDIHGLPPRPGFTSVTPPGATS